MRRSHLLALSLSFAAVIGGCKDNDAPAPAVAPPAPRPQPSVRGLNAIPGEATAVIGVKVGALATSVLVRRVVEVALRSDPSLDARLRALLEGCGIDPGRDLAQLYLATGRELDQAALVVEGEISEDELVACVGRSARADGGELRSLTHGARTLHVTVDAGGREAVWFAFGAPGVVVVTVGRAWLEAALGDGAKVADRADIARLIERAGGDAAVWAAGEVAPAVGRGLVEVTGGAVTEPPAHVFSSLRLEGGLSFALAAELASAEDAAAAAKFAQPQLQALAIMAQTAGLGPLVSRIEVEASGDTLFLRLRLSAEQVKEVLSQIDTASGRE